MKRFTTTLILFLACGLCHATTLYVPDNQEPPRWTTIQAAINNSTSGDTIIVTRGTYTENIQYGGKNVTIQPVDGHAVTIDGGQSGPVVTFDNAETNSAVLDGFIITNGSGQVIEDGGDTYCVGGGVYIYNAEPTVKNCEIVDNTAEDGDYNRCWGGGIYAGPLDPGSSPRPRVDMDIQILNNEIHENYTVSQGSAMFLYYDGPDALIYGNEIYENESYYGGCYAVVGYGEVGTIDSNVVHNNTYETGSGPAPVLGFLLTALPWGEGDITFINNICYECHHGATLNRYENFYVYNNTFADNDWHGLCISVSYHYTANAYVYNNIFYGNGADQFNAGADGPAHDFDCYFDWNCVEGGQSGCYTYNCNFSYGGNNVTGDPDFVDAANDDYHIDSGSSCLDEASATYAPAKDFEGDDRPYNSVDDIGADEYTG